MPRAGGTPHQQSIIAMRLTLSELLARHKTILYDGATGSLLQEYGLPIGVAPEKWVLENPVQVYLAVEAYVRAGAQIVLTCTFGGTAYRLLEAGLDAHAAEINRRAAELAREAAGDRALVAGSIGPLGQLALVFTGQTFEDAVEQFAAQTRALVEGGVDLIAIESMSDLEEVRAAVQGVREVTDRPVLCTLSFDTGRKTLLGVPPALAARELAPLHLDAIGANCGSGPEEMAAILQEMRSAAPDAVLIAKPNAGLPVVRDGRAVYDMDPERFAHYAREWVTAGARIVGGCCGTTPRYVEVMRSVLGLSTVD